jgi:hypothetical protein
MSPTLSLKTPSPARRALILVGLPVLLAIGSVGSPLAQSGPAEHGAAAGPGHRRHHGQLGPIAPAILRDSIGVTGSKLEQYTRRYDSHMAATKPARDSLEHAVQAMRSAFQSGDRAAAGERRQAIRRQSDQLAKSDKQFEASVKDLLSKDQQKRYAKWQEEQVNLARGRWHRERPEHGRDEARPQG